MPRDFGERSPNSRVTAARARCDDVREDFPEVGEARGGVRVGHFLLSLFGGARSERASGCGMLGGSEAQ
jgi:hypothetical protein